MVVSNAANYIHVPVQSVYALFNGRSFAMKTDTRIDELGMYNGCCVTVFIRLLGGVHVNRREPEGENSVREPDFTNLENVETKIFQFMIKHF